MLTLGSAAIAAKAGQTVTAKVAVPSAARRILRRTGRIRTRADITLEDAAGNATTRRYVFSILAPR